MQLIYDPSKHDGPMNVVAWCSGSCTTIEEMLKFQKLREYTDSTAPYKIVALVTDNADSNVHSIAARENKAAGREVMPVIYNDFSQFMRRMSLDPENKEHQKDGRMRFEYDARTVEMLVNDSRHKGFELHLQMLAGYMKALHRPVTGYFQNSIINSHPARLDKLTKKGKRRFTGDNAVRDTIAAGELATYTSIHIVREQVDAGEILVTSAELPVSQIMLAAVDAEAAAMSEEEQRSIMFAEYERRDVKESSRRYSPKLLRKLLVGRELAPTHQDFQKIVCDYPAYIFALVGIATGDFALERPKQSDSRLNQVVYKGEYMPYAGVELDKLAA